VAPTEPKETTVDTTVSAETARTILDLYAEVFTAHTGQDCLTGLAAYRRAEGPVLMVPESMAYAVAFTDDKVHECDTTGNGHPAIVLEGETGFCACCDEIAGCWTQAAQELANERGLRVLLEPYAGWAVNIYRD